MFNKKSQIGETLTWLVATLIIVIILVFFLFGASMLADTKDAAKGFTKSFNQEVLFKKDDLFLKKSIIAYFSLGNLATRDEMEKQIRILEKKGKFNLPYNETKDEIKVRFSKIWILKQISP